MFFINRVLSSSGQLIFLIRLLLFLLLISSFATIVVLPTPSSHLTGILCPSLNLMLGFTHTLVLLFFVVVVFYYPDFNSHFDFVCILFLAILFPSAPYESNPQGKPSHTQIPSAAPSYELLATRCIFKLEYFLTL